MITIIQSDSTKVKSKRIGYNKNAFFSAGGSNFEYILEKGGKNMLNKEDYINW